MTDTVSNSDRARSALRATDAAAQAAPVADGSVPQRPDPTVGFRRVATAIALPLAIAAQVVTNTVYSVVTTSSGLDDLSGGAEALEFYRTFATEMQVASVASLIGSLLLVPGLLAALRVLRPSRPRLSLWAAVLMIAGYVCYFGVVTTNFLNVALATGGVDAAAALDEVQQMPTAVPVFLLFVIGNIVGTALLGLAVMLSRGAVPWFAGVLILAWPVSHVIGLSVGSEWFEVAGGTLEVIGLAFIAVAALRMSNAEWVRRG
ncbi:hypothetical protein [Agromyces sp. NPDC058110]|uniref:hypothetical protein n=1 Tax=Agromyces sp. NPDC058110 TaxID=3346345 RepID=UPI0036DE2026